MTEQNAATGTESTAAPQQTAGTPQQAAPAPTPTPTPMPASAPASAETGGFELGIGEEVKSSNLVPFQPTWERPISLGFLKEVKHEVIKTKDKGDKEVISFSFIDAEGLRTHKHVEWELDPSDKKFAERFKGLQERIKHIYCTFAEFPKTGLGKGKNFKDFFESVATAFNTSGVNGGDTYKGKKIYIKLIYAISGNYPLGFPLSPNFLEKYVDGKVTTLFINKQYETLDQPKGTSKKATTLPTGAADNFSTPAAGGAEDFPEFAK